MAVPYEKKHLTLQSQLNSLRERKLDCGNDEVALQHLHDFSYYTLSAYWYPFRRLLDASEKKDTRWQYRTSEFLPGAKLSDAVALATFDRKIKATLFDGLSQIELALRFQIAYVAGKRSPFFHTQLEHLDAPSCQKLAPQRYREDYENAFQYWLHIYDQQIKRSLSEDFMQHYHAKYSSEVPIWMATEVLDFGSLIRLYGLLNKADQSEISKCFGVSSGPIFHGILTGLNVLRNHVAHHNRVWNRRLSTTLSHLPQGVVGENLDHLQTIEDQTERKKLYPWAAVLAYLLREYDPSTNWHRTLRTVMKKFPTLNLLNGTHEMAAPDGWLILPLWSSEPGQNRITVS